MLGQFDIAKVAVWAKHLTRGGDYELKACEIGEISISVGFSLRQADGTQQVQRLLGRVGFPDTTWSDNIPAKMQSVSNGTLSFQPMPEEPTMLRFTNSTLKNGVLVKRAETTFQLLIPAGVRLVEVASQAEVAPLEDPLEILYNIGFSERAARIIIDAATPPLVGDAIVVAQHALQKSDEPTVAIRKLKDLKHRRNPGHALNVYLGITGIPPRDKEEALRILKGAIRILEERKP